VLPNETSDEVLRIASQSTDDFMLWPGHQEELRNRLQRMLATEHQRDESKPRTSSSLNPRHGTVGWKAPNFFARHSTNSANRKKRSSRFDYWTNWNWKRVMRQGHSFTWQTNFPLFPSIAALLRTICSRTSYSVTHEVLLLRILLKKDSDCA
jgi:hypothetical protein